MWQNVETSTADEWINWETEKNLDFDESMIKYSGKHPCKQFTSGNPLCFGDEMWCLNTQVSLLNFNLYQGQNRLYKNQFGKCIAPLITIIDGFP